MSSSSPRTIKFTIENKTTGVFDNTRSSFDAFWGIVRQCNSNNAQFVYYYDSNGVIKSLTPFYSEWLNLFELYGSFIHHIPFFTTNPNVESSTVQISIIPNYTSTSSSSTTNQSPSNAIYESEKELAMERAIMNHDLEEFKRTIDWRGNNGVSIPVEDWKNTKKYYSAIFAIVHQKAPTSFLRYLLAKRQVNVNANDFATIKYLLSKNDITDNVKYEIFELLHQHGVIVSNTNNKYGDLYEYCFQHKDPRFYKLVIQCKGFEPNTEYGIIVDHLIELGDFERFETVMGLTHPIDGTYMFDPSRSYNKFEDNRNTLVYAMVKDQYAMFELLWKRIDSDKQQLPVHLLLVAIQRDERYLRLLCTHRNFSGSFGAQTNVNDKASYLTVSKLKLLHNLDKKYPYLQIRELFKYFKFFLERTYSPKVPREVTDYLHEFFADRIVYKDESYVVSKKRSCTECQQSHNQCDVVIFECKKVKNDVDSK